ncbi:MAG: hypothetical protein PHT51_01655 [Patescibacteria group bacterium]|nr:hypothetical protein [Patescibacteria group bacterium]MDD4610873.1 hypothetical protein [Patescibacteria group bacterium]
MSQNSEDSFRFLKDTCYKKSEIWKETACDLFQSAQILLEFNTIKWQDNFPDKEKRLLKLFSNEIVIRCFWIDGIIRMLWGFGFENILKGIIIQKYKNNHPLITSAPLELDKIYRHGLIELFKDSDMILSEKKERFYIELINKHLLWIGRYPLPKKVGLMYEEGRLLSNGEWIAKMLNLFEKRSKGNDVFDKREEDSINSGIDKEEVEVVFYLKNRAFEIFDNTTT